MALNRISFTEKLSSQLQRDVASGAVVKRRQGIKKSTQVHIFSNLLCPENAFEIPRRAAWLNFCEFS